MSSVSKILFVLLNNFTTQNFLSFIGREIAFLNLRIKQNLVLIKVKETYFRNFSLAKECKYCVISLMNFQLLANIFLGSGCVCKGKKHFETRRRFLTHVTFRFYLKAIIDIETVFRISTEELEKFYFQF